MKIIVCKNGEQVMVDDEDYHLLIQFNWYVKTFIRNKYAVRKDINTKKIVRMHRFIMNIKDRKVQVDHINRNGIDNRKENLRLCNNSENQQNSKIRSDNTSGFKGVHWKKDINKWNSVIKINGKAMYLGSFLDKIDAAKAYNKKALELFGEFARINIID